MNSVLRCVRITQLTIHRLKQRRHVINAQSLLGMPEGVAIRDVGAVGEQAKALIAQVEVLVVPVCLASKTNLVAQCYWSKSLIFLANRLVNRFSFLRRNCGDQNVRQRRHLAVLCG